MRFVTTSLGILCIQVRCECITHVTPMADICPQDVVCGAASCVPDVYRQYEFSIRDKVSAGESLLLDEAVAQIEAYMQGKLQHFSLPLAPEGTAFMQSVWQALRAVPYGQTSTYGLIARAVGRPKAYRAVGMACRRNPILLMIPCHRIIGTSGKLVGFQGGLPGGLERKKNLLSLEQASIYETDAQYIERATPLTY